MRFTALAVAALAAAFSPAAVSAEPPACTETMEHVVSILEGQGVAYKSLTGVELVAFAEKVAPITGVPAGEVTGAIVAAFGVPAFGIETKDGCFSANPIPLPIVPAGVKA